MLPAPALCGAHAASIAPHVMLAQSVAAWISWQGMHQQAVIVALACIALHREPTGQPSALHAPHTGCCRYAIHLMMVACMLQDMHPLCLHSAACCTFCCRTLLRSCACPVLMMLSTLQPRPSGTVHWTRWWTTQAASWPHGRSWTCTALTSHRCGNKPYLCVHEGLQAVGYCKIAAAAPTPAGSPHCEMVQIVAVGVSGAA